MRRGGLEIITETENTLNVRERFRAVNSRNDMVLFGGTASRKLAASIAQHLDHPLGVSFVEHFPDGEINVRLDEVVRGRAVFIVQSTCPPVSENLLELLAFADACHRSAAASITAVLPYFGYARSDKRHGRREPIMASMIAELVQSVGMTQLLTVDLHASQIEGFFRIPVDNMSALPTLVARIQPRIPAGTVVVSPDEGRLRTATEYARRLGTRVVVLHKERESGSITSVAKVVGDVRGQVCLIIDDLIATGGTIAETVQALLRAGAKPEIYVAATHGLFVDHARQRLTHPAIREILITDSVPFEPSGWREVQVVSLAPLLAAAIRRLHENESMADLYVRSVGVPSAGFPGDVPRPDEPHEFAAHAP